jgi:hypothetical protein
MPDVPLGKVIKPKNDVYSVMLVLSFLCFLGAFVMLWVWLAKDYDSGFPGLHGHKLSDEAKHRKENVIKGWAKVQKKDYLDPKEWPALLTDYDEKTGVPTTNEFLPKPLSGTEALARCAPERQDEELRKASGQPAPPTAEEKAPKEGPKDEGGSTEKTGQ